MARSAWTRDTDSVTVISVSDQHKDRIVFNSAGIEMFDGDAPFFKTPNKRVGFSWFDIEQ